ncbi:AraC family transcriptional regulator [Colwellia sp. RE-S-Sl-9]
MQPEKIETGSNGFVWKNVLPDELISQIKLHVYTAHKMKTDTSWAGSDFINHYNRLYYVESGEAVLQFKDIEILMQPGYLYLIPAYQLISHYSKGDFTFYWTHFQASLDANLDLFMIYGKPQGINCKTLPHISQNFDALIQSMNNVHPTVGLTRMLHLLRLLEPFIEKFSKSPNLPTNFKHQALIPALDMIQANLTKPLEIQTLAEISNLSPEHFSRKFKSAFNISPKRYILSKRIELAKQLLLEKFSVGEVSEQCGFCDLYHFSRTFKQSTGMSPTQFCKAYGRDA